MLSNQIAQHVKYTPQACTSVGFYLGETTLAQIITRERETIEKLKADQADRKYLQKLIPHLNWY